MSIHLERGKLLLQQGRIEMAKKELRLELNQNPSNTYAMGLLGFCHSAEKDHENAAQLIESAIGLEPNNPYLFYLQAKIYLNANRFLDYALHKSPEDPLAHTNKGWVAIENDNFDEAVTHFKEALRLSPTFEFAKTGLKEAIKGKNIFYRQILKFFLWTSKMNDKGRWQLIIGAYIIYRIILWAAESYPTIAPLLYPLIIFYLFFVFSSWIAQPFSNLFLRLHPLGKLALSDDEKFASNLVGTFLLIGLIFCVIYFATPISLINDIALLFGGWFIFMLIPLGGIFIMEEGSKARKYLAIYTGLIGLSGLAYIAFGLILDIVVMPFIYAFALGIFFYGWVANYLVMKAAKEY